MFIVDFGKTIALYNSKTTEEKTLTRQEFLNLPNVLQCGSKLVSEDAHLGCPQKKKSRAQLFTEEELFQFYTDCRDNGIELRLFPQFLTKRARNQIQLAKTDDISDTKAIAAFLDKYPTVSLKKPKESFSISNVRQAGLDFKAATNDVLNYTRGMGYAGYLMDDDAISVFLRDNDNIETIIKNAKPGTKDVFGLTDTECRHRSGANKDKVNFKSSSLLNLSQLYSVAALLLDTDGNLRIREHTGKLPGWKFIKYYVIGMSAWHFKGGVCRSNLYHHGMKHWISRQMALDITLNGDVDKIAIWQPIIRKMVKSKSKKITKEQRAICDKYKGLAKILKKKRRGGKRDENMQFVKGSAFTDHEEALFIKYRKMYCEAIKDLFMVYKNILVTKYGDSASYPVIARDSSSHPQLVTI